MASRGDRQLLTASSVELWPQVRQITSTIAPVMGLQRPINDRMEGLGTTTIA
jgi:hypothetical protein